MNQIILAPLMTLMGLEAFCSHCRVLLSDGTTVILGGNFDHFLGIVEEISLCKNCNHKTAHLRLFGSLDEARLYLDIIQRQVESHEVRLITGESLDGALEVLHITHERAHQLVLLRLNEN